MNAAQLRAAHADETTLHRMTSSAPPLVSEIHEVTGRNGRVYYDVETWEEPADQVGQSLSGELVALIGNIRADFTSYGPRHPIRRALAEWDRHCGRRHQSWYDHDGRRLCGEMVRAVIEGGASVMWCADRYGVSWPRAERHIIAGLNYIGGRVNQWEQDRLLADAAYTPPTE